MPLVAYRGDARQVVGTSFWRVQAPYRWLSGMQPKAGGAAFSCMSTFQVVPKDVRQLRACIGCHLVKHVKQFERSPPCHAPVRTLHLSTPGSPLPSLFYLIGACGLERLLRRTRSSVKGRALSA